MRKTLLFTAAGAVLLLGAPGFSEETKATESAAAATHVVLTPPALKWGPAPARLPKGASLTVLSGDPGQPGPFTIRLKAPAGYKVMPHWHPTTENLTVLSGTFAVGMGETFDAAALKPLPAGSFAAMPAEMRHFAQAKTAVVLQVHGMGPFTLNYVNPADDPSTAPAAQ